MRIASRPLLLWISTASASASALTVHGGAFVRSSLGHNRSPWLAGTGNSLRMSSSSAPSQESSQPLPPSSLRVALCQFLVTHDKETNQATARAYLARAKQGGAAMAVLPEIWNSPYATKAFPEYAEVLPDIGDSAAASSPSSQLLIDSARDLGLWIVGGSIPERVPDGGGGDGPDRIYNTCLVLDPRGTVVAKHRKVHLFDIDVPGGITFFESETLSPGSSVSHFATPYGEIGVGICYDIRFAEYAMLLRQKHGCVVLVFPGAFNMTTGPAHWELLQRARAVDNQCFVVSASPARSVAAPGDAAGGASKYPHYTAWGHSTVVSPWGDIVATTDEKEGVVIADLDLSRLAEVRRGMPIGDQKRSDLYSLEQVAQR